MADERISAAREKLAAHGQEHLLAFVEELGSDEREVLLADIEALNFELIDALIPQYVTQRAEMTLPEEILPAPMYPALPPADLEQKYAEAREHGEQLIAAGKVACFVVAGGQGTRLGFDGPKGAFPATPVRQKMLFQVFAEGMLANQRQYGATIPWYVMTSPANHAATVACFEENGYFGLDPAQVMHFPQNMMPCFDESGKILLAEKHRLATAPDGHGGSLRALHTSGAIDDMTARGVEYLSYFQVDNPLVYVVDPLFVGLHALEGAAMSSKAVIKCDPLEKVGNFTLIDGRVTVIEYSDLPEELALKTTADGKLTFEAGSIAIHVINRDFVAQLNEHGFSLPWHRADKRVPYVDGQGQRVDPAEPNGVKLETFVFDALPLASTSIVFEIDRNEQFAPIKNATGADSVGSSHQLQTARAVRWLEAAGVSVPRRGDGSVDAVIEISPLLAHHPEALREKAGQLAEITAGETVYLD